MSNNRRRSEGDDIGGVVLGIAAAIGLGLLGAAIIDALTKPKCPNCRNSVERNTPYCKNCGTILRWQ